MIGILMSIGGLYAQSDYSSLSIANIDFGGTARYNAMGGAMAGLGGDLSTFSYNPAGIGLFRRHEISFTPGLNMSAVENTYLGTFADDIHARLGVSNFGFVSSKKLTEDKWKYVQFGVSYNRLKDFNSNQMVVGTNPNQTLVDQLIGSVDGLSSDNFNENASVAAITGWNAYLFDPTEVDGEYVSNFDTDNIKQVISKESRGRIGETAITFGGNYDDRLYLGATVGFQRIKTSNELNFREIAEDEVANNFMTSYVLNETIEAQGDGINLKLGAIYRVNDNVRLGLSYHTPTYVSMTNEEVLRVNSEFSGGSTEGDVSDNYLWEYSMNTPSRFIAGVGLVLSKKVLVDVDYERVDYSSMKVRDVGAFIADYSDINTDIRNNFTAVNNLRVGGEIRLAPFSFRAGAAYYENPNKDGSDLFVSDKMIYSGGLGYRNERYHFDIGYRLTAQEIDNYYYSPAYSEAVDQTVSKGALTMTMGMRF